MNNKDPKRIIMSLKYNIIAKQMNELAKEQFGDDFHISSEEQSVKRLVAWILGLEKSAKDLDMDLNKGILLVGKGTRKNRIMDLMRRFTLPPDHHFRFEMVTCSHISNVFSTNGPAVIEQYTTDSFTRGKVPIAICFTELGREMKSQHYGTHCYVMDQILLDRSELYFQRRMMTHVTTSLTSDEIEARYGVAMRDYLRERFNRVVISEDNDCSP
jgi:hypothetical protein